MRCYRAFDSDSLILLLAITVEAFARTQTHETVDPPAQFHSLPLSLPRTEVVNSTLTNNLGPVAKNYFVTKTVSACVSARTASEPLTGSPIMATLDIPKSWTPTAENLWALPKPLRRYIHHLQSNVDHVETMRENFRLRQENAALRKKLAGKLSELRPFFADHFYFGPKG